MARNARFAEALGLDNAELSSKIIPRYSEFMKDWFKKDQDFCSMVHTKLLELVNLSKESKHKSRSYSFPVMNRDKRQFVHEYSDHFGCESQSYDAEPKRNVVVTAVKDKCSLPSISLQVKIKEVLPLRYFMSQHMNDQLSLLPLFPLGYSDSERKQCCD